MTGDAATILIVEDEPPIRRLLRTTLTAHDHRTLEAATGAEALSALRHHRPDLVLLDLGLPDIDGQALIGRIRELSPVPIVILSSRGDEAAKVAALDAGADDYVTKPFGADELMARLRAALRHRLQEQGAERTFASGDLSIDLVRRLVRRGPEDVKLSPKEYDILEQLAIHAGKVLTHKHLLRGWQDTSVDPQYLRVYVSQPATRSGRPVLAAARPDRARDRLPAGPEASTSFPFADSRRCASRRGSLSRPARGMATGGLDPHRLFFLGGHDRLQDALELAVGVQAERRQGKTQAIAHQPEAAQRALQGNGIGLEKQRGMERRQELVEPLDVGVKLLVASPVQGRAQGRRDVGRHRNATVTAGAAKRRLAGVVAGQQQGMIAQPATQARDPGMSPVASLSPTMGSSASRRIVTSSRGAGGARGDVVEDNGNADRVVDGAEVHHHARLCRLEIGGVTQSNAVAPRAFRRRARSTAVPVCCRRRRSRYAPGGGYDRPRHDAMMFVRRQQRCLAGRAAGNEADVPRSIRRIAQRLEGCVVDLAEAAGVGRAALEPRAPVIRSVTTYLLGNGPCSSRGCRPALHGLMIAMARIRKRCSARPRWWPRRRRCTGSSAHRG
jgi:two-component system KDP operon response regulator KdpE